uniref:Uncharacterized protein n=1 Tax=Solanum tuberosum TaxID=4113 RepID=M1DRM5_SOLTU
MAKTKRKQAVTSDTESDRESPLLPLMLKKKKGIVIHEQSEAPRQSQPTTQHASTYAVVQPIKGGCKKRMDIRSKLVQPSPTQAPTSRALPILPPRSLNRLKAAGEHTILEDKWIIIDDVLSDYPAIWDIIRFHCFEGFTRLQNPYVLSWKSKIDERVAIEDVIDDDEGVNDDLVKEMDENEMCCDVSLAMNITRQRTPNGKTTHQMRKDEYVDHRLKQQYKVNSRRLKRLTKVVLDDTPNVKGRIE